ncbi:hypothetical protein F0U60_24660 [Archangium minus]|uniref:Uncharacterized protein n=1 Tax=Archangium minus TaxID=83450 RepID=A0ABY9WVF5_9BACT|nr:hypothetical protein F0U60_24660 [Archangium minus]
MRILPLTNQPPWRYDASEVLNPPKRTLSFEDIVKRVRRFRSDSVVLMGSRLLWHFWNNPSLVNPNAPGGMGNRITQTYAERIISLACAYGSAYNRPAVSEVEFRLLCWELSWGMGEGFFTEKMVDSLRDCLGRVALARAHWVLFAMAAEGGTVDVHGPKGVERIREQGLVILREAQGEEVELREKLGLTADSLRAVAKRLSMSQPGFSQLREELDAKPPALRRYAPQTDWLNIFPMIDIGVGELSEQFIAPSPWWAAGATAPRPRLG